MAQVRVDGARITFVTIALAASAASLVPGCILAHRANGGADGGDVTRLDVGDVIVDRDVPPLPDSAGCNPGEMRCAGTCVPVDLATRCGRCENDCTALFGVVPGAVSCAAGMCSLAGACQPRYADCNGSPDDGCETDVSVPEHCGACTTACDSTAPLCTATGTGFSCATGCSGATSTLCGTTCVDVTTDPAHCGACDRVCTTPANSRATCTGGVCEFVCDPGYHSCGDHCAADASITECGSSCVACTAAGGATTACVAGACAIAGCPAGFGDCNGVLADGCETGLATPANCGTCGASCTLANATPGCTAGACSIASCNAGFADCNGSATDGCETNTNNPATCGTCGTTCATPTNGMATCTAGVCGIACNPGFTPMTGACVMAPSSCGNRALDLAFGETCDDGNNTPGDGCSATCQLEQLPADTCPGTPIVARRGTQWYTGATFGAVDHGRCNSGAGGGGPDRVYELVTADGGNVTIELVPSPGYDTIFIARQGTCPGVNETFCVNGVGGGGTEWITTAVTSAGARYTVVIDSATAAGGAYAWRITID